MKRNSNWTIIIAVLLKMYSSCIPESRAVCVQCIRFQCWKSKQRVIVSRLAGNIYIHMQTQVEFCSCEFAILAYLELYLCNVQSYSKSTQYQAVSYLTSTDSSVIENSICNCHAARMSRFYNSNVQSMFSEHSSLSVLVSIDLRLLTCQYVLTDIRKIYERSCSHVDV